MSRTTTHAHHDQANKLVSSFSFSHRKLSSCNSNGDEGVTLKHKFSIFVTEKMFQVAWTINEKDVPKHLTGMNGKKKTCSIVCSRPPNLVI